MLSHLLAPWLARRDIHYGWAMAGVTFLTMLATSASLGLPGVLIVPLRAEFGWGTGAISGPLALRLVPRDSKVGRSATRRMAGLANRKAGVAQP